MAYINEIKEEGRTRQHKDYVSEEQKKKGLKTDKISIYKHIQGSIFAKEAEMKEHKRELLVENGKKLGILRK